MSVFRIEKTKNYTVMSNHHLRNKDLSLKAKGLMSLLLSLPNDWDYSISGIISICQENITAVRAALKELENNNYLVITKLYPGETESGRIEYEYCLYEIPINIINLSDNNKKDVEKQDIENLVIENQVQLSTKEINTKEKVTETIVSVPEAQISLLPIENKRQKKAKDMQTIRSMTNNFADDDKLLERLRIYQDQRSKKGLVPEQWRIILADLKMIYGNSILDMISQIDSAIAGGYMQIVPSWEKTKKRNQKTFDNTSGRKTESVNELSRTEKLLFNENLAKKKDGSLYTF